MKHIVQDWQKGSGFHRLRNTETGKVTHWAPYQCITLLDGVVGHTAFYGTKEGTCTPEEFCNLIATQ